MIKHMLGFSFDIDSLKMNIFVLNILLVLINFKLNIINDEGGHLMPQKNVKGIKEP
jgi:hypothetical protein